MCREAADVRLVNDSARPWPLQGSVSLPVIGVGIGQHTFHCGRGVIAIETGGLAAVIGGNRNRASVGIEQHLGGIEPEAPIRLKGPECSKSVDLTGLEPG